MGSFKGFCNHCYANLNDFLAGYKFNYSMAGSLIVLWGTGGKEHQLRKHSKDRPCRNVTFKLLHFHRTQYLSHHIQHLNHTAAPPCKTNKQKTFEHTPLQASRSHSTFQPERAQSNSRNLQQLSPPKSATSKTFTIINRLRMGQEPLLSRVFDSQEVQ